MRTHIRFNALAQHPSAFCRSRHPKDALESLASRRGDYIPPSITPLSSDITPLQGSKHKASWMLERFFTAPRGHGLREVFRSPVRAPRWTLTKKEPRVFPLQYYHDDTWSTYSLFNPHKNPGGGCKQPHTCVCYSLCTIAILRSSCVCCVAKTLHLTFLSHSTAFGFLFFAAH